MNEELRESMLSAPGIVSPSDKEFLEEQAAYVEEKFITPTIVNIGVARGASCYCLRLGAPNARLIGVDPLGPGELYGTPEMLEALNLEFLTGRSQDVYGQIDGPIHLIFVDGDHCCEGVSNDIKFWVLPHVVVGGVAIFHDAHFADGDPFHHVGDSVSKAIDTFLHEDWEEQPVVIPSRWFIRR